MANAFTLFGELRADTKQFKSALTDAERRLGETRNEINQTETAASNLGKTSIVTARSFQKMRDAVAQTQERLQQTTRAFQNGSASANQMRSALLNAENAAQRLNSRLADQSARLADAGQKKTSFITKLGLMVGAANLASTAITAVAAGMKAGAQTVLAYSASLEQTKIGFETLMGSAAKAQRHIADLQQFAKRTPFEFAELTKASQRLQGVGVAADKVIPLMRDLGNAVAAVGGSTEQVQGVTVALSQMISKQKVSAEEMEQLAERGINGWQILSKELNITQGEARKLAEDGKISSDIFVAAFQKFSQAKFGDAMEKQSRTFNGALSNIKDGLLITASTAFEPLFEQIRNLAVRFATDLERQGTDFRGVGQVIAQYIGEGLGLGVEAIVGWFGNYLGTRLKEIFSEGKIVDPISKSLFGGFLQRLGEATGILDKTYSFKTDAKETNKTLDQSNKILEDFKKKVSGMPSLAQKLETEKIQKAWRDLEQLGGIVSSLGLKVSFFGDETEVAATKQQLLSQGFRDFNSGLARQAILWAEQLDNLKAGKRAQDEFNNSLKSAQEELKRTREDARFEIQFPDATRLDKFNQWVRNVGANFRSLKGDIELTAQAIKNLMTFDAAKTRTSAIESFTKGLTEFGEKAPVFQSKLKEMLEPFNLSAKDLDSVVKGVTNRITELYDSLSKARNQEEINFITDSAYERAQLFLNLFKDVTGSVEAFARDSDMFGKFIKLWNGLIDQQSTDGMKNVGDVIDSLGFSLGNLGGKNDALERINALFADPANAQAIAAYATSVGRTVEELQRLLTVTAQSMQAGQGATRLRIVPEAPTIEWSNFFDTFRSKAAEMRDSLGSIKQSIGENLINSISDVGFIFSRAIDEWDGSLKGFFASVAKGFGEMVTQILADIARIALQKAILNLIGSIAGSFGGGKFDGAGAGGSWATGGYTGGGSTSDVAGVVHKKEYVMPWEAVRHFGLGFMENIKNLRAPEGWASGGFTGGMVPSMAGATTNNNNAKTYNINVSVNGNSGGRGGINLSEDQLARAIVNKLQKTDRRG